MNNLLFYKRALVLRRELTQAIKELETSSEKLSKYKKFLPIVESLVMINDSITILNLHLNTQNKIIERKGLEE